MSLDPLDTSPEAHRAQGEAHAGLGPEGRLNAALELSESTRTIRMAGLREEHPELSEPELVQLFVAECYGVELELPG